MLVRVGQEVYSRDSDEKFHEYLQRALEKNSKHPRAHYLLGLDHSEHERLGDAAAAYERAIECYPATDKFHLNETWNNLGNVYYRGGRTLRAYAPRGPAGQAHRRL